MPRQGGEERAKADADLPASREVGDTAVDQKKKGRGGNKGPQIVRFMERGGIGERGVAQMCTGT